VPVDGYRTWTEITVRFAETDAQGIAHHSSFVVWCEVARMAWLVQHAGGYRHMQEQGIEALTTEAHLRYLDAVRFDDRLRVWTRCTDLTGARLRFEYVFELDGKPVCEGWTGHATVDRDTHRPVRVPEWFAAAVDRAES
jgi:acyl-CoA thioester hydrolase